MDSKKLELEKLIEHRTKGTILRAKCRWHNEGEKNTKYFLNLEKRNYKQGTISQLKLDDEQFVSTDKEILNECETYKRLYSSSKGSQNELTNSIFFGMQTEKNLNLTEQKACKGLLSKEECLKALKDMECNKTPGSVGLPAEFYKVFWNDISDLFLNSINYAYRSGQLSVTQRRGIIKLIPKKDAEPNLIKNSRPISLLNCDYKIAAKAIANRFKQVIPNIINYGQTGFLKGRFIGENIRLIDGIIKYTAAKNIPGLLLFLEALGVWLSTNPKTTIEANYNEKLTKIRNSLSCWELRRLTLLGKITVLESLIASQLVYILSPLPSNHSALTEINNMFFNFVWDGKGDKVKHDIMINDYENGGLRMIDIKIFNKALKSSWVKKYLDPENQGKWKLLFDYELQNLGGVEFFRTNLNKQDLLKTIKTAEAFTSEILHIWSEISLETNVSSIDQLKAQSLWHNSLIRVGNKPVYYRSWSVKGVKTVGHLMNDANSFLSFSDFKELYDIKTNFLTFQGILSAVKALQKSNEANFQQV